MRARSQHGSGGPDARRRAEDTEDKEDSHAAEDEDPRQVPRQDRGEDTADRQDGAACARPWRSSLMGIWQVTASSSQGS